jgi:hypothetical protein
MLYKYEFHIAAPIAIVANVNAVELIQNANDTLRHILSIFIPCAFTSL